MNAIDALSDNANLSRRRRASERRLNEVRSKFQSESILKESELTVFCAGSLGRGECAKHSDLDLFVLTQNEAPSRLLEVQVLSALVKLNENLGFPDFSQEMRYLRLYRIKDLVNHTGKPIDDSENSFTTRMLLILESAVLTGISCYEEALHGVVANYFRDNIGKSEFRPLFLINDLLRYWRTLCLNYEQCRNDKSKPWRKKNINLKFSRMTTVFSTISLMMTKRPQTDVEFLEITKLTPLERLASAVDQLGDTKLTVRFSDFLESYDKFMLLKDLKNPERVLKKVGKKDEIRAASEAASKFIYDCLMHDKNKDIRRYLVI